MSTDPLDAVFPLPEGMRLHTPKFGTNPVSALVPALVSGDNGDSTDSRPEFKISWEDQLLGLKVLVRELENGRLCAEVFCTNPSLRDESAVSVGFMGAAADHVIGKTIPLGVPENNRRSGSADFGPLTDVVKDLGPQLGLIAFLLV